MTTPDSVRTPAVILCADWGKTAAKRAVYRADVSSRVVARVSEASWTATTLLDAALRIAQESGPVLVAFDVPLGLPVSYLAALSGNQEPLTFLDLLRRARTMARFYVETSDPRNWGLEQPFFTVPQYTGGLTSYADAAAKHHVSLRRSVDVATEAKSVFIKSGIPGSVGSAACSLWQELAPACALETRGFRLWPFEGTLDELLASAPVTVGEMYPRAAYATAISNEPMQTRARLFVGKTDASIRRAFLAELRSARWVRWQKVTFRDLDAAEASEDDFDACVTAAALLRCVLEEIPLAPSGLQHPKTEGGILGTGSINLDLSEQRFAPTGVVQRVARAVLGQHPRVERKSTAAPLSPIRTMSTARRYPCPIPGCTKVFEGTRGGWDAHVQSLAQHPHWHPDVSDPVERKRLFKVQFPAF